MDAMQVLNQAPIKAVFVTHFMLSTWAMLGNWLPPAYLYYSSFFLLTLLWSMHSHDSSESVLMTTIINLLSILLDAICIGAYYNADHNRAVWFGFSVFMAIANLLLRPISSLVLLRVYNERCGRYSTFGFPGLSGLNPSSGNNTRGGGAGRGAYENLDTGVPHQAVPSPIHDVESNNPPFSEKSY